LAHWRAPRQQAVPVGGCGGPLSGAPKRAVGPPRPLHRRPEAGNVRLLSGFAAAGRTSRLPPRACLGLTQAARLLGVGLEEDQVAGIPAGAATRAELANFQGRSEAQLARVLSLVRTGTPADAGATTEPPPAAASTQVSRREPARDGGASSGRKKRTNDGGHSDAERQTIGNGSDADSLLGGLCGGPALGGAREDERRDRPRDAAAHPDGFDDTALPDAGDIMQAYEISYGVRWPDGIFVPFEPSDARFLSRFKEGSSEYHEAAFAYQMAAWSQELSSASVDLFHQRDSFSAAGLADRLAGADIAACKLFHLATAQYDYLEYRQRDPVGAELYRSIESVPGNTLRGPNGQRWLSVVARDEIKINIKAAAEERASRHRRRGPKRPAPGPSNRSKDPSGPKDPARDKKGGGRTGGAGGGGGGGGGGARA